MIKLSTAFSIGLISMPSIAFAHTDVSETVVSLSGAHDSNWQNVKDELWAKELAIYIGRSRGDLSVYLSETAMNYLAWPPFSVTPKGNEGLEATGREMAGKNLEKLEMTFLDMALNGDSAVIYYKTHRTRLADGTRADQHYEVTHTWVRQDGGWKVFGGMARERPVRK